MKDYSWFHDLPLSKQHEMLEGPAMKPPKGVKPNFAHPPNHNDLGNGVLIAAITIATLLIASRIYVRIAYYKKLVLSDFAAIAALGSFVAFVYYVWTIINSVGFFVHQWNVQFKDMRAMLYALSGGSTVYGIVILFLKIGILLHWMEIFVPTGFRNGFWWTCHITIWVNVLFYVICTFIELFGCAPRAKLWDPTLKGKCLDMLEVNVVSACVNFFSDMIILLLPQRVIWGLQLSLHRKLGTAGVFAVGSFATTCAAIRIKSSVDFAHTDDLTYEVSRLALWCIAEMMGGFFVLCLPTMPKLVHNAAWIKWVGAKLKLTSHSASKQSGASSERKATRSWPRSKPRRAPDASLFTDTSFVNLTSMSQIDSNSEQSKSLKSIEVCEVRPAHC